MQIKFEFKTEGSNVENCPARYKVIDGQGGYVVQGKVLDAATRAQLRQLGPDEEAIWVPRDIIER